MWEKHLVLCRHRRDFVTKHRMTEESFHKLVDVLSPHLHVDVKTDSYSEEDSGREDKMTGDDDSVKSAKASGSRVPKLRKDSEWDMFEHKFLAYAEDKNFVVTEVTDKKVRKILKQNRKAVLAFSEALGESTAVLHTSRAARHQITPKDSRIRCGNH
jgi:hypothetical protein